MNTRFLMTLCCCLLPFTLKGAGKEDMKWFTDAKFGMFIHWGLYSQTAGDWKGHPTKGGEHFMLYERIPVKEYALIANDFNPTEFNARKWVKTAKEAGMKYIVITSKHHDGFAMYHSACSDYNIVTRTPFARDPMKELADECRKQGLKFGFYYSLGRDWEDPDVPTNWPTKAGRSNTWDFPDEDNKNLQAYIDRKVLPQLTELLTNYGEVFEVWFDGANGGDGWYGGAKDVRTIDRKNYYNYPRIYEILDSIQPQAVIFSDGGPGCRWVGNERGFAGATNWSFLRKGEVYPGYPKHYELQYGHADGNQWVPAECDVSIRPGWFYHPEEDDRVKTPEQLVDLYYRSVGHNGTLLLNFPVDRNGLINPIDSANAVKYYQIIQQELKNNLVAGMKAKVSNERGGAYVASAMTDEDYDTYWATEDSVKTGDIEFSFSSPQRMNRMMLQEYIPLGQRVKAFTVEYKDKDGKWLPVRLNEETTTIGYKRLLRFETVVSDGIRIRITDARGPLCINNIGIYDAGQNADISYDVPTEKIESLPFTLTGVAEDDAKLAVDRNNQTTCFVNGNQLIIDLGEEKMISSFHFLPDQSEPNKGLISNYELAVGNTADQINKVVKAGEFSNIRNNPVLQSVYFTPTITRYISLKATRMVNDGEPMGFAEIAVK